jgi:hypothetical protein
MGAHLFEIVARAEASPTCGENDDAYRLVGGHRVELRLERRDHCG